CARHGDCRGGVCYGDPAAATPVEFFEFW
nr:immunoglobulin heavy chain junction region [Macaca mulatta]MOV38142.1 immunoglobulin heavy chain junction region [Macaca mulatta]MOV38457.1 immunoglobulin heavy chain junction region [Macaca mulatta]MOV39568.1 immunoglobulin heavy chain junction region [Macaca mulatta]MOV42293.1 immunoglobulin heavy chain junction region [Macaca mulatta]